MSPFLPLVSGVLLALAYYSGLLVPNFVSFLPMLLWLDVHRERSVTDLAKAGVVFGLTTYGIALHWVYAMLSISWLAVLMYVGLVVLLGSGATLALTLVGWARRWTGWSFGLLLPVCWIPFEWVRTWGDLRMTADHVGHSLAGFPFLVQFDDVVGPYGVGAFLLASNGLLYEALRGWHRGGGRRAAAFLGVLVAAVLAYDGWAWTHPPEEAGKLRVALIQPNIPLTTKWDAAEDARQEKLLADLTLQAAREKPDLILWPESARPRPIYHWLDHPSTFTMPEVQQLAVESKTAILTGVEYFRIRDRSDYQLYNAALVARPDGRLEPTWTAKVYLVPFAEGIPFPLVLGRLLGGLGGGLRWLAGGFTPGPAATPLPVAGGKVGVLICYEELYFDLARALRNAGAGFQVIVTNDAWFGRTVFQRFQADTVRMRAIENRSAFVRVANTGISGFVDPLGRYHERTGLFEQSVLVRDVPITNGRTLYDRMGDVVAWLAVVGMAATVLVAGRRCRSGPRSGNEVE